MEFWPINMTMPMWNMVVIVDAGFFELLSRNYVTENFHIGKSAMKFPAKFQETLSQVHKKINITETSLP